MPGARLDEVAAPLAEGADAGVVELDFAPLHREEDLSAAAIAEDDLVIDAEHLQRQHRERAGKVGAAERADDHGVGLHDVLRLLHAAGHRVGAHVIDADVADPAQQFEIVIARAKARAGERLRQRMIRAEQDGQAVLVGPLGEVIDRRVAARAGHVLDDHIGIAGQMLAQMAGEAAHERVRRAAGVQPDDHPQRLAGVELLRRRRSRQADCRRT